MRNLLASSSYKPGMCLAPCRSAELDSANLARGRRVGMIRHPAEYNSAIQQIENLRYSRLFRSALNTYS